MPRCSLLLLLLLVVWLWWPACLAAAAGSLPRLLAESLATAPGGGRCASDSQAFLSGLDAFHLDAVQMLDASVKTPVGVLWGSTFQLGHYDECVGVASAQYCLARVHYRPLEQPRSNLSAWPKLQSLGDVSKIPRERLEWALCVPASCSPQQLGDAFRDAVAPLANASGVWVHASFDEVLCSTLKDTPHEMGTASAIYLGFVAFLVALVIASSVYDKQFHKDQTPDKKKGHLWSRLLLSFSMPRNVSKLTHVSPSEPFLDVMHSYRAFFMAMIVLGHRLLTLVGHPIYNGHDFEQLATSLGNMIVVNGPVLVDIFFTFGGVVLAYFFVLELRKSSNGKVVLMAVLNRYLRLTPLYALVIGFYIYVLPYMGSGPYWKSLVVQEQHFCEEQWWANILYINNYLDVTKMCMLQSWYLCADFQLFILGLILVYLTFRWPRVGWTLTAATTLLAVVIPFVLTYYYELYPFVRPYGSEMGVPRSSAVFKLTYTPTHARAAPYLVGMVAGTLLHDHRVAKFRLPKAVAWVVLLGSWLSGFAILMSAYMFYAPGRPFDRLESATYCALQKVALALTSVAGLICTNFADFSDLRRFLMSTMTVVLSRLTYSAFILHMSLQLYDMGTLRTPRMWDAFHIMWAFAGDYLYAYILAFFGFLVVEAPFRNLIKIFIG